MKRLSDERTLSRWAYPNNHARVRSRPTAQARTVAKLHWLTEDNLPEIYLVLASWRDAHKNTWVKIRVPKRPNGVTGWVPRRALRQYTAVRTFLDLNRSSLLPHALSLRPARDVGARRDRLGREPDAARALLRAREVPRQGRTGLRALRAGHQRIRAAPDRLAGGGVVGLHGTNEPGLIPGRPSHGCIRLRNEKITRLYRLTPRGTPMHIHD